MTMYLYVYIYIHVYISSNLKSVQAIESNMLTFINLRDCNGTILLNYLYNYRYMSEILYWGIYLSKKFTV